MLTWEDCDEFFGDDCTLEEKREIFREIKERSQWEKDNPELCNPEYLLGF